MCVCTCESVCMNVCVYECTYLCAMVTHGSQRTWNVSPHPPSCIALGLIVVFSYICLVSWCWIVVCYYICLASWPTSFWKYAEHTHTYTHIYIYLKLAQFKVSHRYMTSGLTIWYWTTSYQLVCSFWGRLSLPISALLLPIALCLFVEPYEIYPYCVSMYIGAVLI